MDQVVQPALSWACRSRPHPGESQSGDASLVTEFRDGALLAVIDGLGHGPDAAVASALAAQTLEQNAERDAAHLISRCHDALRRTRGAAMLVLSLSFADRRVEWAGIGNVEGWHVTATARMPLISMAGVVGYQIATPRQRHGPLTSGDLFVLASDGVSASFAHEVRFGASPDELAESILFGYARQTDDALVLVARYRGDPSP